MDKVEAIVETKVEEVTVKLDEVLDKVEEVKIEKPEIIEKIIDKLDDIAIVKDAIENVVEVVDGRKFSCFCWGWILTVQISQKKKDPVLPKPVEESPKKEEEKPSQQTPPEKSPQPTAAQ